MNRFALPGNACVSNVDASEVVGEAINGSGGMLMMYVRAKLMVHLIGKHTLAREARLQIAIATPCKSFQPVILTVCIEGVDLATKILRL